MSKGFIPIRRSLFEHFLYKERRAFSRFEAWLDLIQMASFKDGQTELIAGKPITRQRGEVVHSIRWIASRWNWSIHRTFDFLELLRSHDMVVVAKENGVTKLSLVNFERYNSVGKDEWNGDGNTQGNARKQAGKGSGRNKGTPEGTPGNTAGNTLGNAEGNTQDIDNHGPPGNMGTLQGTPEGTNGEHRGNKRGTDYNKENKEKKENGEEGAGAPPPPGEDKLKEKQQAMQQRRKAFEQQLVPFVATYGRKMVRAFCDYWSEPNKSKTKMKFELEPTWDLEGRFRTWENRELEWKAKTGHGDPPAAKVAPTLSKIQEEVNYLYGMYLEGQITVISVDWMHFNELARAKLVAPSMEDIERLKQQAVEYIQEKQFEIDDDLVTKYAKRFGVLEFFMQYRSLGKETVFKLP